MLDLDCQNLDLSWRHVLLHEAAHVDCCHVLSSVALH